MSAEQLDSRDADQSPPVSRAPVVAHGRRGALYVEVTPTRNEDFVLVLTTRGQRYAVRAESVQHVEQVAS